ncbi:phosphoribosylaminoimidazole carboxylase ade2 [Sticta canariensis]|nr:phosphoribosylaminoimidazole carboxylase ade2 [Sticta canariensis]
MDQKIGVLGGGQLGRMLTEAASRLNINVVTLDGPACPAKQINAHPDHVNGSFNDPNAIRQLAAKCDVLTVEIEHVNTNVLEDLSHGTDITDDRGGVKNVRVEVQPSWRTIRVIQDKYEQKLHLIRHGIAVAHSRPIESSTMEKVQEVAGDLGYPFMLKSRTEAYDGRGNYPIKSASQIFTALATLQDRPLYAEKWANFTAELAVMVVKTGDNTGQWEKATVAYPAVETIHEDSICKLVYAPARNVSSLVMQDAQNLARQAVAKFWGRGVFGVEMFLLEDGKFKVFSCRMGANTHRIGKLLVNEIAPRPHNSGHYTIEACSMSQYEAHIRAILRLPITERSTQMRTPNTFAVMLNILGGAQPRSHLLAIEEALRIAGANIHLYGKGDARPGRKMGHVTVLANSMEEAELQITPLIKLVNRIRAERKGESPPVFHGTGAQQPEARELAFNHSGGGNVPLVAITMGSDSDRFVLTAGIELLKDLDIPHSVTITSAHRTPERMFRFAREAASKGVRVIIAAAGGAAHLPGMIAAITSLPVIGIPVKGSVLDGNDSLLSIVQMPVRQTCFIAPILKLLSRNSTDSHQRGCPVATVAINNSINAAQLAVRILALSDAKIRERLKQHLADQTASVIEKGERMERVGFEAYGSKE